MTQLTEHFTLAEMIVSPTAKRLGLSNQPTAEHIENMRYCCEKILEPVREHFGKPVRINSSYRAPLVNKAVGGSKTSQHVNGQAIDFEIMGVDNKEVADWIGDNLEFDQCILEFYTAGDKNSGWVHASIKKEGGNRMMRLIASKSKAGGTKYTPVADFDPKTTKSAIKKIEDSCPHCGQKLPTAKAAAKKPAAPKPAAKPAATAPKTSAKVTETNPMKALQQKCGVTADGLWGPGTFKAAKTFLKLSPNRAVHFFAQCGHESGNFKVFSENLNYSATALNRVFPKYFVRAGRDAQQYNRQPEKIANVVYANRMGNGDEASGDGWKYRGRGAIQLTGKNNYTAFSKWANRPDVLTNPDIVATELAFESAVWFFESNGLWSICDQGFSRNTITTLTKRINGGTHGLDDRIEKTIKYSSWI